MGGGSTTARVIVGDIQVLLHTPATVFPFIFNLQGPSQSFIVIAVRWRHFKL